MSACATGIPPIGTTVPFTPAADERLLWAQAEREATALLGRVRMDDDPALLAYLARLGQQLTPPAVVAAGGPSLVVSVIRDPTLDAFALPDGRLFVHTGLLAALESEAQLALLLAREIAHVVNRDALAETRGARAMAARYEGAAVLSPTAAAILGAPAPLARLAAMTGYGGAAERRADADALASLARAGRDAWQAVTVYDVLAREAVDRGGLEVFALGSPARLQARGRALRERAQERVLPAGGSGSAEEFQAHRLRVSRDNAVEDARAGRFALARRQLDRVLAAAPADATAHVYDADLHRLQAQRAASAAEREAELEAALDGYARALALEPGRADVHRQLGLLHYQRRDVVRARAEFQDYVRLAPTAADARRVAEYARELER
jgi:Zn-dependent protease with chaperone function